MEKEHNQLNKITNDKSAIKVITYCVCNHFGKLQSNFACLIFKHSLQNFAITLQCKYLKI